MAAPATVSGEFFRSHHWRSAGKAWKRTNGAGKSTLLRCLYRYLRPTSGTIDIDSHEPMTKEQVLAAAKPFLA